MLFFKLLYQVLWNLCINEEKSYKTKFKFFVSLTIHKTILIYFKARIRLENYNQKTLYYLNQTTTYRSVSGVMTSLGVQPRYSYEYLNWASQMLAKAWFSLSSHRRRSWRNHMNASALSICWGFVWLLLVFLKHWFVYFKNNFERFILFVRFLYTYKLM